MVFYLVQKWTVQGINGWSRVPYPYGIGDQPFIPSTVQLSAKALWCPWTNHPKRSINLPPISISRMALEARAINPLLVSLLCSWLYVRAKALFYVGSQNSFRPHLNALKIYMYVKKKRKKEEEKKKRNTTFNFSPSFHFESFYLYLNLSKLENENNRNLRGGSKGWQLMISGVQKALISGWYPWYPAVGFGRNMAVFSDFSSFSLFDHCPRISSLYLGISSQESSTSWSSGYFLIFAEICQMFH